MFGRDNPRRLDYAHGLALIRIGFGLYVLSQVLAKLMANWLGSAEPMLRSGVTAALQNNTAEAIYRPFLEGVVQPNALLFSQLVTIGELVVAVSLTLGLFTRLGGILGMWLNLNYMLMKGLANNAGSNDRLFFLAELVFAVTAAGLVWGLDGKLSSLFARNPLTRWLAGLSDEAAAGEAAAAEGQRLSSGGAG